MLRTRIITAIVALAFMLTVFLWGNTHFLRFFFALSVGVSTFELSHMLFPRIWQEALPTQSPNTPVPAWFVPALIGLACLIFASSAYTSKYGMSVMMLGLMGGMLGGIFIAQNINLSFTLAGGILVCLVYGTFPWLAIWELYQLGDGPRFVFFLCCIVWSGDTGAYFAGRALGKHKLAPNMSPNKTWEGAVGGILAPIVGGLLPRSFYTPLMVSYPLVLVCSILGGALGQLGDLAESTFKRFSGVKDSGRIFPGHGGFLDRVDGLLFAAPAVWFILFQFGP